MRFLYTGWFVEPEEIGQIAAELAPQRLEKKIEYPHITLVFKPEQVNTELFGSKARITVTGYGNDGENEGVLVKVEPEEETLRHAVLNLDTPHITLSIAEGAKAVNTRKLEFHSVEPVVLEGIFGGMTADNVPCFEK